MFYSLLTVTNGVLLGIFSQLITLQGMGDFIGEMLEMMSQTEPNVRLIFLPFEFSDPFCALWLIGLLTCRRTAKIASRSCSSCLWRCSRMTWMPDLAVPSSTVAPGINRPMAKIAGLHRDCTLLMEGVSVATSGATRL